MSLQNPRPDTRVNWQFGEHRAVATLNLAAGRIYVLSEDEGNSSNLFREALRGRSVNGFRLQTGEHTSKAQSVSVVAADEKLVSNLSVPAYLEKIGVPSDAISTVMSTYELGKLSYLTCSQLPAMAARQLELLTLLRSGSDTWVLDDPFQPFNGRWREDFAQQVLDQVAERGILVVVTHLSFTPQCWQSRPELQPVSLDELCAEALQKVHRMTITQARESKPSSSRESQRAATPTAANVQDGTQLNAKASIQVSQSLIENFAYRPIRDWIFEPLARIGSFSKGFSGALGFGIVATLILIALFVFLPALQSASRLNLTFWDKPAEAMPMSTDVTTAEPENKAEEAPPATDKVAPESAIVAVTDSSPVLTEDPNPAPEHEAAAPAGQLEPVEVISPPQIALALVLPSMVRVKQKQESNELFPLGAPSSVS